MSLRTTLVNLNPARFGLGTTLGWLGAFISFPAAGLTAQALVGSVDNGLDGLIGGTAGGLVIGLGQWLVLRRTRQVTPWWIAASGLGLGSGLGLAVSLVGSGTNLDQIVMRSLVTGALLGLAQSAVLARHLSVAALWTAVVTGAFTLAWVVSSGVIRNALENGYAIFGSSGAILFQLITGLTLLFVLKDPVETDPVGMEK